jgi:hypothetical protein
MPAISVANKLVVADRRPEAMTDEIPDTGNVFTDLIFAAGAIVTIGVAVTGFHAIGELLRRKDRKEDLER